IGVTYLSPTGDNTYRGFRLSSGLINEFSRERGVIGRTEMDSWLSARENGDGWIWSLGLAGDVPYVLAWGPVRLLARGSLGLEYRTDEPHRGLGVLVGVGPAAEVWLSRHVLLTVGIERQFALPGGDNTQLGAGLRFVEQKLPALIPRE